MKYFIPILTVFVLLVTLSFAQPPDILVTQQSVRPLKSEKAGVRWSIGTTVAACGLGVLFFWQIQEEVGLSMIGGGLLAGPSVGHFYANQWGRGCIGIGSRILVGGATTLLLWSAGTGEAYSAMPVIGWIGCGATLGLILWDIATVPHSVRRHNIAVEKSTKLNLLPIMGNQRCGLLVVYSF